MNTESIVSRVWSFCTTLRDDGVDYGDYLEQLTYLIFLKMALAQATLTLLKCLACEGPMSGGSANYRCGHP